MFGSTYLEILDLDKQPYGFLMKKSDSKIPQPQEYLPYITCY